LPPPTVCVYFADGMDGRELREERKRLGLTQRQVADHLGVSQQFVSQMERGVRPIPTRAQWSGDVELESIEERLSFFLKDIAAGDDSVTPAPRGPYQTGEGPTSS
jgi:transcriptional regulator with XRE-family HTH domain